MPATFPGPIRGGRAVPALAGPSVRRPSSMLAPSHYALFRRRVGLAADIYRTRLATCTISERPAVGESRAFVLEPKCVAKTRRPGTERSDTERWEHSGEVQVPFLQKTLKNFSLCPIVNGEVDPEKLRPAWPTGSMTRCCWS